MEEARALQDKLDHLQEELASKVQAADGEFHKKKNAIFAARRETIATLVKEGKLPRTFWADAVVAALELQDKQEQDVPHFLGPYDAHLLQTYLEDFEGAYTEHGYKLTLRFAPNPFFTETELSAEAIEHPPHAHHASGGEGGSASDGESSKEDDDDDHGEQWVFSGVTWQPGHGPQQAPPNEDEEDEEEDEEDEAGDAVAAAGAAGKKRPREESASTAASGMPAPSGQPTAAQGEASASSAGAAAGTAITTEGPSMLDVFSFMLPHPDDDDDLADEPDDVVEEAVEDWEEEMRDRRLLVQYLFTKCFQDPLGVMDQWELLRTALEAEKASAATGEDEAKKAKTE